MKGLKPVKMFKIMIFTVIKRVFSVLVFPPVYLQYKDANMETFYKEQKDHQISWNLSMLLLTDKIFYKTFIPMFCMINNQSFKNECLY